MPKSLVIDTAGGSDFAGHSLRNVGTLHVGGSGLATAGYALQVSGKTLLDGDLDVTGAVTGAFPPSAHTHPASEVTAGTFGAGAYRFTAEAAIAGGSGSGVSSPGTLALMNNTSAPFVSYHNSSGVQIGFVQIRGSASSRFFIGVNQPLEFATNGVTRLTLAAAGGVVIPATDRLYLDGNGDTYISEVSANVVRVTAGGVSALNVTPTFAAFVGDVVVEPTKKFRLDGSSTGDTYLYEAAANIGMLTAGGTDVARWTATSFAPGAAGAISIGTAGLRWTNVFSVLGDFSGALTIAPTQRLYLDGGGDSYLLESSANIIQTVVGGSVVTQVSLSGHVPGATNAFSSGTAGLRWSNVFSVLGNFSGAVTAASFSGSLVVTGGSAGVGRLWVSAANGLEVRGVAGSSNDFHLTRPDGTFIMRVPTGTSDVTIAGIVRAGGGLQISGFTTSFGANDSAGAGFRIVRVPN